MIISDTANAVKYQPSQIRQTGTPAGQEKRKAGTYSDSSPPGTGINLLRTPSDSASAPEVSIVQSQQPGKGTSGEDKQVSSRENSEETVQKLNNALEEIKHNRLEFSVHEDTGRTVVKIIDQDTGEVIKQLPPEELLDLAEKLKEMSGVLFDKKI